MSSIGIATDYPNGIDQVVATDPMTSRHVQTEAVKHLHKAVARKVANASTRELISCHVQTDSIKRPRSRNVTCASMQCTMAMEPARTNPPDINGDNVLIITKNAQETDYGSPEMAKQEHKHKVQQKAKTPKEVSSEIAKLVQEMKKQQKPKTSIEVSAEFAKHVQEMRNLQQPKTPEQVSAEFAKHVKEMKKQEEASAMPVT